MTSGVLGCTETGLLTLVGETTELFMLKVGVLAVGEVGPWLSFISCEPVLETTELLMLKVGGLALLAVGEVGTCLESEFETRETLIVPTPGIRRVSPTWSASLRAGEYCASS